MRHRIIHFYSLSNQTNNLLFGIVFGSTHIRLGSSTGRHFAHFAEQVLQNGRLTSLIAVQSDCRNERHDRSQSVRSLSMQFQQFRSMRGVIAFLNRFRIDVILPGALLHPLLRQNVILDHARNHVQQYLWFLNGLYHTSMIYIRLALDRSVLAIETE